MSNVNEEIHARIADIHIKMHNLSHAYAQLLDAMADKGLIPLVNEQGEHKKMPADPELGDTHH